MGADNWTYCPKCALKHKRDVENAEKKRDEAYGKVSREDYKVLENAVTQFPKLEQVMREDYDIGIRDGLFSVSFGAYCEECGFRFDYKWSQSAL